MLKIDYQDGKYYVCEINIDDTFEECYDYFPTYYSAMTYIQERLYLRPYDYIIISREDSKYYGCQIIMPHTTFALQMHYQTIRNAVEDADKEIRKEYKNEFDLLHRIKKALNNTP